MPSPTRLKRISDRIGQEISEMLIRDLTDPRLQGHLHHGCQRGSGNGLR